MQTQSEPLPKISQRPMCPSVCLLGPLAFAERRQCVPPHQALPPLNKRQCQSLLMADKILRCVTTSKNSRVLSSSVQLEGRLSGGHVMLMMACKLMHRKECFWGTRPILGSNYMHQALWTTLVNHRREVPEHEDERCENQIRHCDEILKTFVNCRLV